MRSPGPVSPKCGDCHWNALLATGRVAREGPAPPHPSSDAACGWGTWRTSRVLGQELPLVP